MVEPKDGETVGCTVYFINSTEPFFLYSDDADKILAAARERCASPEEIGQ